MPHPRQQENLCAGLKGGKQRCLTAQPVVGRTSSSTPLSRRCKPRSTRTTVCNRTCGPTGDLSLKWRQTCCRPGSRTSGSFAMGVGPSMNRAVFPAFRQLSRSPPSTSRPAGASCTRRPHVPHAGPRPFSGWWASLKSSCPPGAFPWSGRRPTRHCGSPCRPCRRNWMRAWEKPPPHFVTSCVPSRSKRKRRPPGPPLLPCPHRPRPPSFRRRTPAWWPIWTGTAVSLIPSCRSFCGPPSSRPSNWACITSVRISGTGASIFCTGRHCGRRSSSCRPPMAKKSPSCGWLCRRTRPWPTVQP